MLEQLLAMVKEIGKEQVEDNSLIPNEENETVMAEASETVVSGFQQALAQGQGEEVLRMFQTNSSAQIMASPVAQNIQSGFIDNLTNKLGINKNVAMGLAATMIPIIISKLVKRTNSKAPEDSGFSLEGLIGSLTGGGGNSGGGLDIASLIGQFTGGGNKSNGAGGGIADILSQLTGGGGQQKSQGNLHELIQGFFRK